jgi:hypothetical protein
MHCDSSVQLEVAWLVHGLSKDTVSTSEVTRHRMIRGCGYVTRTGKVQRDLFQDTITTFECMEQGRRHLGRETQTFQASVTPWIEQGWNRVTGKQWLLCSSTRHSSYKTLILLRPTNARSITVSRPHLSRLSPSVDTLYIKYCTYTAVARVSLLSYESLIKATGLTAMMHGARRSSLITNSLSRRSLAITPDRRASRK